MKTIFLLVVVLFKCFFLFFVVIKLSSSVDDDALSTYWIFSGVYAFIRNVLSFCSYDTLPFLLGTRVVLTNLVLRIDRNGCLCASISRTKLVFCFFFIQTFLTISFFVAFLVCASHFYRCSNCLSHLVGHTCTRVLDR